MCTYGFAGQPCKFCLDLLALLTYSCLCIRVVFVVMCFGVQVLGKLLGKQFKVVQAEVAKLDHAVRFLTSWVAKQHESFALLGLTFGLIFSCIGRISSSKKQQRDAAVWRGGVLRTPSYFAQSQVRRKVSWCLGVF